MCVHLHGDGTNAERAPRAGPFTKQNRSPWYVLSCRNIHKLDRSYLQWGELEGLRPSIELQQGGEQHDGNGDPRHKHANSPIHIVG